MFKYIALATVELFSGFIGLSEKQAARRGKALKKVKDRDGVYEILTPVQFKAKEIIGLENPDKTTLSKVELTPESLEMMDIKEKERIDKLVEIRAEEILDKKACAARVEAAREVIDQGLITGSGAPEIKAMEKILGYDITAAQRDVAWESLKKDHE